MYFCQAGYMMYIFYGSLGILLWKCGTQLLKVFIDLLDLKKIYIYTVVQSSKMLETLKKIILKKSCIRPNSPEKERKKKLRYNFTSFMSKSFQI